MTDPTAEASFVRKLWNEAYFWGGEIFYSFLTILMTGLLAQQLGLADSTYMPIKNAAYPRYAFPIFIFIVILLYLVKYNKRVAYGLTEIEIATFVFLYGLQDSVRNYDLPKFTFLVAGSVYIGVRGLDNVVTGVKARYIKTTP